jgi:hypothetical protein
LLVDHLRSYLPQAHAGVSCLCDGPYFHAPMAVPEVIIDLLWVLYRHEPRGSHPQALQELRVSVGGGRYRRGMGWLPKEPQLCSRTRTCYKWPGQGCYFRSPGCYLPLQHRSRCILSPFCSNSGLPDWLNLPAVLGWHRPGRRWQPDDGWTGLSGPGYRGLHRGMTACIYNL